MPFVVLPGCGLVDYKHFWLYYYAAGYREPALLASSQEYRVLFGLNDATGGLILAALGFSIGDLIPALLIFILYRGYLRVYCENFSFKPAVTSPIA